MITTADCSSSYQAHRTKITNVKKYINHRWQRWKLVKIAEVAQMAVWEVSLPALKSSFAIMLMKVWFTLTTLKTTSLYCFYFLQGTQNLNRSCQPTICFQWQPTSGNIYNNSSKAQKCHIFHKYSSVIRKKGLNDKKKYFCFEKE